MIRWIRVWLISALLLAGWGSAPVHAQSDYAADSARITDLISLAAQLFNQNLDSALLLAEQARDGAAALGDTLLLQSALGQLGAVQVQRARYDEALRAYNRVVEMAMVRQDSTAAAFGLHNVGKTFEWQGRLQMALESYQQAYQILPPAPRINLHGVLSNSLGNAHNLLGQADSAELYYEQALAFIRETNNTLGAAFVQHDWGLLKMAQGELDTAKVMMSQAERLCASAQVYWAQTQAQISLGQVSYALGQLDSCRYWYEQSLGNAERMGNANAVLMAARSLATVYYQLNRLEDAIDMQNRVITFQDTLYQERFTTELAQLQNELALEQRERENAQLRQQQLAQEARFARQQLYLWGGGGLLLALVGFTLVLSRSRRRQLVFNAQLSRKNEEIERQHGDIQDSLAYAQHLQRAILPETHALRGALPDHFVFFRPLGYVSGDVYWHSELPDGVQLLAAIDCTGHGAPGAMLSVLAHSGLQQAVQRGITQPGELLEALQLFMQRSLHEQTEDGLELGLVRIEPKLKRLIFAGAGRSLVGVQRNELLVVKGNRQGIHGKSGVANTWQQVVLEGVDGNDTFYLFSDGFEDQFGGAEGKKYYPKRLRQWLLHHYRLPMQEQAEQLEGEFDAWKGAHDQVDDVLVMGFRPWPGKN